MNANVSPVLSLKRTSCLCIIANLREFSARNLMRISKELRKELLLSIPVHEISFLEQTGFVEGIDMEAVWAALLRERIPPTFAEKLNISPLTKCSQSSRQKYMETLAFIILNKVWDKNTNTSHYQLALDLLFSVHYCLGIYNWRKLLVIYPHLRKYFYSFPPPRQYIVVPIDYYNKYYKSISDVQLISLLLDGCHFQPTQINLFAPSFVNTHLWKEINHPSAFKSFRRFLTTASSLWLCSSGSTEHQLDTDTINKFPQVLSFIIVEMIKRSELKHLHLQAPDARSLSLLLDSIAGLLATLSSYQSRQAKKCTPYNKLKELTLTHDYQPPQQVVVDTSSLTCLFRNAANIVSYQPHLKEVNLGGIKFTCRAQNLKDLITALVQHVNKESGSILTFNACHMMLDFFLLIIETFLRSQVFNDQVLNLSRVIVEKAAIPKQSEFCTSIISMSEECFNFKYYKISDMYLPSSTGFWLLYKGHQIRLHTLELHGVRVDSGCSLLNEIAKHPNFRVRKIYLSNIDIPHCYITVDDFQQLLVKKDLEVLSISDCNIGETGVLQDITIAFSLLLSYRYTLVSVLTLKDNKMGAESDEILQNFFAALFSMRSIQALGLDIRSNQLKPQHFKIMVSEWKRCAGDKKLRQLHCQGNEVAPNQKFEVGELSHWTFV